VSNINDFTVGYPLQLTFVRKHPVACGVKRIVLPNPGTLPRRNDNHGQPWPAQFLVVIHVLTWSAIKTMLRTQSATVLFISTLVNHGQKFIPWLTMVNRCRKI